MVTRAYFSEEEPTFRRCGPRGQSFPLAQERAEHPYASRGYNDGRSSDHGSENIEPGHHQMRRRIQVACLRCRKRKIRCSGEDAGRPCYHCKNSSSEECVFLRVTAFPTEKINELSSGFLGDNSQSMYNRITSNAAATFSNNYFQSSPTVLGADSMSYRSNNYPNYGYQGTRFLPYDNFTEEPAEFSMSSSTQFQVSTQDPVSVSSYPAQNNGRARVNPPPPMYMDSEATSNYSQNAYQNYNARSMVDSESKNFCVTNTTCLPSYGNVNVATSPQPALNVTNGERILPHPSTNRQYRSVDIGLPSSQNSLQSYGYPSPNMGSSGKMNRTSIQMPLTNSYMNAPTSSSQEITTHAADLAYLPAQGQQTLVVQQDADMYDATTSNSSLYYSQPNDSTADISHYGPSSGSDISKSRQNSQTNTTENAWSVNSRKSSSSGSSLLANGQQYLPHTQSHYPTPSITSQMQNHGLLQPSTQTQSHMKALHDGLPNSSEYVSSLSSR